MAVLARWLAPVLFSLCSCGAKSGLLGSESEGGVETDAGRDAAPDAPPRCAPGSEICNDVDDDCDGVVDDGLTCFFLDGAPIDPVPATGCGASWYRYDFPDAQSANPSPDIRRSNQVVLAIQYDASCGGAHVGVIADIPQDGSGGQLLGELTISPAGAAGIVVSDEPNECSFDSVTGSGICNWVWQPCCTDGILLGPFASDACLDLRLSDAVGVSQLVVLDGPDAEIPFTFPAALELCTRVTPAN